MTWLLAGALLLVGAYLSVLNWICVVQGLRGRSSSSWMPLAGGVLGMAGCLVAPGDALEPWWWIPLVVDFGSAPGLTYTLVYYAFVRRPS